MNYLDLVNTATQYTSTPQTEVLRWFEYSQNNSGGSFKGPAHTVLVQAPDADRANRIAKDNGLYFDGDGGCSCCGNRWSDAWEGGEQALFPTGEGADEMRENILVETLPEREDARRNIRFLTAPSLVAHTDLDSGRRGYKYMAVAWNKAPVYFECMTVWKDGFRS